MKYDSKADTLLHIKRVNQLMTEASSELTDLKLIEMRYINGFNQTIATEHSDLKYGEYRCTECNKVITREQVIPNDRGQSITTNSINFCSRKCRSENRNGYDRTVSF